MKLSYEDYCVTWDDLMDRFIAYPRDVTPIDKLVELENQHPDFAERMENSDHFPL